MKRIIFKNLYSIIFATIIWLVIYCFFTNKYTLYFLLGDVILHLILLGIELYKFKLDKDIKKLEKELFNEKRNNC